MPLLEYYRLLYHNNKKKNLLARKRKWRWFISLIFVLHRTKFCVYWKRIFSSKIHEVVHVLVTRVEFLNEIEAAKVWSWRTIQLKSNWEPVRQWKTKFKYSDWKLCASKYFSTYKSIARSFHATYIVGMLLPHRNSELMFYGSPTISLQNFYWALFVRVVTEFRPCRLIHCIIMSSFMKFD